MSLLVRESSVLIAPAHPERVLQPAKRRKRSKTATSRTPVGLPLQREIAGFLWLTVFCNLVYFIKST